MLVIDSTTMERRAGVIPFNKASVAGKELFYIAEAVVNGDLKGGGPFTARCETWLEEQFEIPSALLTTSCSSALEMAALLARIKEGDQVILPSFTFTSTANAFLLRGAELIFADIRADTLNLDESLLPQLITERTKVIVPMHYAGVACEMDSILALAKEHALLVVEDAAHAILARYKGKPLGSIGDLATFSFHETKNFSSGEGGALLLNNQAFIERAEILLEKGTNRSQFFRGEVDKYSWMDVGGSFLPSEVIAAFLYGQLECVPTLHASRMAMWQRYYEALTPLAEKEFLRLPYIPEECEHNAHMFYVLMPSHEEQMALIEHCKNHNVCAVFHYMPLHSSPQGRRLNAKTELKVTEDVAQRIVRLPLFYDLSLAEQNKVIEVVFSFFEER